MKGDHASRALGDVGEQIAAEFLCSKGYKIIERNHYTSHAELDIIALSPGRDTVTFIEVKARSRRVAEKYGRPAAAVSRQKQKNIIFAAEGYMRLHPDICSGRNARIDVIEIFFEDGAPPLVNHIRSAVTARRGYNRSV